MKNDIVKIRVIEMLKTKALADRNKALLTLELMTNNASGIGDHSTDDFYNNLEDALTMLIDADDKINKLKELYPDYM